MAARVLARAAVDLKPMRPYLEAATGLAVLLDHPAYDCVYLAMAEAENTPFVTADERFLRKVRSGAFKRFANLLLSLDEAAALKE